MTQDEHRKQEQTGKTNGSGPMRLVTFLGIAILLAAIFAGATFIIQLASEPNPTPTTQHTLRPTFTPSVTSTEENHPPNPTQPSNI